MFIGHGCFSDFLCQIWKENTTCCHHCSVKTDEKGDTALHTLAVCPVWERERGVLRAKLRSGEDLSLGTLVKAMLRDESAWKAVFSFCKTVMSRKEEAERADIIEMHPYSRFNKGYHYIFTVIDVLSKYAWAVPFKSKGGSETANAFAKIIRKSSRHPKNLQTNMGKEFHNADVQKRLKKHNINHYSTYSVMKASVVERFNCMLKNDMWKQFTFNGNYKWIDMLPRLVFNYNTRKHRTIGMRPIDVTLEVAESLLAAVYNAIKITGPAKFKVGDSVRSSIPIPYLLEDYRGKSISGAFYEYELHRAIYPDVFLVEKILRRKGDEVYVKWLGFDGSHNSWIHKDNII
ncbi:uncharacterized protein LOC118644641 [Monomorium pharaonis]|uniref:uncharacterized protein LOC118644641 n=1 Tax=Monomorium pharaonis TaxID=307658 RepID=UPI00174705F6|nr:uncharacterized protein LOC118644641 [Monomorium pharaonis]